MNDNIQSQPEFAMTKGAAAIMAAILSTKVHKEVVALIFEETQKASENEKEFQGLYFNQIGHKFSYRVSRTTLHRAISELMENDRVLVNKPGQISAVRGPKLVYFYRIRPEALPIVKFLYPSLRP